MGLKYSKEIGLSTQFLADLGGSAKESLTEKFSQSMLTKVQNCWPNRLPAPSPISFSAVKLQGQSDYHQGGGSHDLHAD